tara:strand:+ start:619 stop:1527 length:909 start_codon:yes stop_codon:yes gene_type:complete
MFDKVFAKILKSVKDFCNDDNMCIVCVFVLAGFLLFMFLNDKSGFANLDELYSGEVAGPSPPPADAAKGKEPPEVKVGLTPEKVDTTPPASIAKKIDIARGAPRPKQQAVPVQKPGLMVQDASIVAAYEQRTVYAPVSMIVKGAVGAGSGPVVPGTKPSPAPSKQGPVAGPAGVRGVGASQGGGLLDTIKGAFSGDKKPEVKGVESAPEGDLKVILVYAPWCGHSKKMLPDYEKVKAEFHGKTVNNSKVSIIMYNSDVDKEKVKEYKVKGFPTLFVEKNGELNPFEYRTYEKISEYIKSNAP